MGQQRMLTCKCTAIHWGSDPALNALKISTSPDLHALRLEFAVTHLRVNLHVDSKSCRFTSCSVLFCTCPTVRSMPKAIAFHMLWMFRTCQFCIQP